MKIVLKHLVLFSVWKRLSNWIITADQNRMKVSYINFTKALFAFLCAFLLLNCKENKPIETTPMEKQEYALQKNEVAIQVLKKRAFMEELQANGKLIARQKNILRFEVSGALKTLRIKNGDNVRSGQLLASLEAFDYRQTMSQAETNLKKADLEFRDILVGRGYDLNNRDSIPDNIFEMAGIRSGYLEAKNQWEAANHKLGLTELKAPFSGKIAGVQYKPFEQVNAGTTFLTLIDDSVFEVTFYLIESEINKVKTGDLITVTAFNSGQNYTGKVSSINPMIEENGMVLIKALIKNDGHLIEGMNVKVSILKEVPQQFVVPKSAVILRQNQEVLFKYQNKKTYWTYVNVMHENSTHFAVVPDPKKSSANLMEGDTIIVSNNLNLAHDIEVNIKP